MIPQAFTLFFLTLMGVIAFMLIFEEKLLAIEEKYDKRKAEQKRIRARQKAQRNTTHGKNR